MSREAKDLIKKLLTYDPKERVSAEEALNDQWISEYTCMSKKDLIVTLQSHIMGSIIQNVSKINVEQKLQQACLSYLANYMGYEGVDEER